MAARMTRKNVARLARLRTGAELARSLQVKKNGKQEIPAKILRQLAKLNLPPNPFVYEACLEKLERESLL